MSEDQDPVGPDHSGGGRQGEHAEGSLTNGGARPGETDEQRSFGAPGHTSPVGEGGGSMSGRGQENPGDPATSELSDAGGGADAGDGSGLSGGLATPLQPGGTVPGGGPAVGQGALGTGGGQTAGAPSGSLKRGGD